MPDSTTETSHLPCLTGEPLFLAFSRPSFFALNHVTIKYLASCSKREPPGAHGSKEVKGKTHTYYQVLIDTRDCPHIVSYLPATVSWWFPQSLIGPSGLRVQCFQCLLGCFPVSAVPDRSGDIPGQPRWQQSPVRHPRYAATSWSLGLHHRRACSFAEVVFCWPGLDYVSHEDILPYNSAEQVPIQHELFERFLLYNPAKCKHNSAPPPPASTLQLIFSFCWSSLDLCLFSFL